MKHLTASVIATQIIGFMVVSLVLILVTRAALLPPPFAYTDAHFRPVRVSVATYGAERPLLRGGEKLAFTIFLRVTDVPTVIHPYGKIINRRTGRAVAGTFGPVNPPVPYASAVDISARLTIALPPDLPPGAYAYEVVAEAQGRQFSGFQVYFRVPLTGVPR